MVAVFLHALPCCGDVGAGGRGFRWISVMRAVVVMLLSIRQFEVPRYAASAEV